MGLLETMPDTAREGIRLRQYGQEIIRLLGDRSVHPAWAVSGGVREPLSPEKRERIAAGLPEAMATAKKALKMGGRRWNGWWRRRAVTAAFPAFIWGW